MTIPPEILRALVEQLLAETTTDNNSEKDEDMSKNEMALNNAEVKHEGNQIILPIINGKPMTYDEGITWLRRKKEEDEQSFAVYNELKCSPLDGAVAFQRAIAQKYGWSQGVPTPGFFGDKPPVMIGVQISATEKMNVPWGRIQIPGIDGYLNTGMRADPTPSFVIGGEVKKKHANHVKELVELTEKILKSNSIYKGKAVKIDFDWTRSDNGFDPIQNAPKFMELSGVKDDDLIFGDQVKAALNIGLFTPIEQSDACRRHSIPLKRGILLHGPYGCGKTMTAYVSAVKAERNGWTFVYLNNVLDLKKGLEFAAQYAPCVIFSEDIDRAITGERSVSMDEVLNILDGVDTKGGEVITVLTTNHIENINPAMLRPGRLDTLVEISPPDAKAATRLVTLYARGLLEEGTNLEKVGEALAGNIPAVIREVTERAKIATISRVGVEIEGKVRESDILEAVDAMKNHAEMLKPKDTDNVVPFEVFVKSDNKTEAAALGKKMKITRN